MADDITLLAYAKINLSLDITGVRPDGYHTISTVMQSVDLYDTVTVEKSDSNNGIDIKLKCNDDSLPLDNRNTAYIAAVEFFKANEIKNAGVKIKIKKNIPKASGMGGGSADAAAVIKALNILYNTNLDDDALFDIAEKVGMDVPFCINGGTQLAEGLGTILTPLPDIEDCAFLLIKDELKPSTAEMYQRIDAQDDIVHPNTDEIVELICEGEYKKAALIIDNSFKSLWGDKFEKICKDLKDNGAINAMLTGSGPTIFGIFENSDIARSCKSELEEYYDNIILCQPKNCSVEEK